MLPLIFLTNKNNGENDTTTEINRTRKHEKIRERQGGNLGLVGGKKRNCLNPLTNVSSEMSASCDFLDELGFHKKSLTIRIGIFTFYTGF